MTTRELVDRGTVLAGRYRVERVLGRGGMGIVVQAMHLELHQPVAVKLMLPEVVGKRRFVERFGREVQAAASLRSEHVARVVDRVRHRARTSVMSIWPTTESSL